MPGSRCLRSFGSLGPFRAASTLAWGPKGALRRTDERKERPNPMPLYEHVFLARQDISQAQVEALTKEYTDVIERGRRQGRQDRVLGPQDRRLQDQEEPQGALLADEHRGAAGGDRRDGAAHGPLARRHPLHHRARRGARDRALHPDAQERPRRPPRRRPRRLPRRRPRRLPRRRSRRLPRVAAAVAASAAIAVAVAAASAAIATVAAAAAATARAATAIGRAIASAARPRHPANARPQES